MRFPLKKGPSQVAQYETPLPDSSASPDTPRVRCLAPVARMTVSVVMGPRSVSTTKMPSFLVIEETVAFSTSAPNFRACSSIFCVKSKPLTASGKPG